MARTCDIPGCDNLHQARGLCHPHYRKAYPNKYTYETLDCVVCGEQMTRRDKGPKWSARYLPCCSVKCKTVVRDGLRTRLPDDHPAVWFGATCAWAPPKPKAPAKPSIRFVSAQCVECGEWFVGDRRQSYGIGQGRNPHCSETCSKRIHRRRNKERRRALKRNAYVADVVRRKVYESDGWRCHICGKKVKRNAKAPDPMAPTLDHVIPLAKGGTHEPANCRTAHFMCNAIKGARGGGEQMLLLAV